MSRADEPAVFAILGLAYGFVLQRSGFCFARAAYEVILLRTREAANGIMAGLVTATVGFGAVVLVGLSSGPRPGEHLLRLPVGPETVAGGLLFGAGMAAAGMCAATTLVRIGEGYVVAWATLAGIVCGAALAPATLFHVAHSGRPEDAVIDHRWPALWAFAATLLALVALWIALARTGRSPRSAPGPGRAVRSRALAAPAAGGIALGLINTLQMSLARPWTVGYGLALVPSLLWAAPGARFSGTAAAMLILDGAMVLGAATAGVGRGLRVRWPRRGRDAARAFAGGVLMGAGIKLAHACNIGGIFSGIPSLAPAAWLYLLAMLAGAWSGIRLLLRSGGP